MSHQKKNISLTPLYPDPVALESDLMSHRYLPSEFRSHAKDWFVSAQFLINYKYAYETYKSYRRDVERFLLWCWVHKKVSLESVDVTHIQNYLDFVSSVPPEWSMTCHKRRYIDEQSVFANSQWRPYIRQAESKSVNLKSLLAILSTYFNYLVDHDYMRKNPIKLLKQKKHLVRHSSDTRVTRKLSVHQWNMVISYCDRLKFEDAVEMRHWWMLGIFYLLGLRISEVSVTDRHAPSMRDFWVDEQDQWWFKVIGKSNKYREVAVPASLIDMMRIYRASLGLPERIGISENTPLLPKVRGKGGLGVRQVRLCVEMCFKRSASELRLDGKAEDAEHLEQATVHWLRHTSISEAVKHRPIEHVRDDAGHSSITITDIYIDSDRGERHKSAQLKKLRIKDENLD